MQYLFFGIDDNGLQIIEAHNISKGVYSEPALQTFRLPPDDAKKLYYIYDYGEPAPIGPPKRQVNRAIQLLVCQLAALELVEAIEDVDDEFAWIELNCGQVERDDLEAAVDYLWAQIKEDPQFVALNGSTMEYSGCLDCGVTLLRLKFFNLPDGVILKDPQYVL